MTRRSEKNVDGAQRRVLGVDISDRAITRARSRTPGDGSRVRFESLDILIDSPEGRFDLVFCAETLYYLGRESRVRAAAERFSELLGPGGLLVLSHPLPQADRLHQPFGPLLKLVAEHKDGRTFRPYAIAVYETR